MKRLVLIVVGVGLFVAVLTLGWSFRSGNALAVDVDLLWVKFVQIELWFLLLLAIGLGVIGSTLILGFAWLRARLLNAKYRRMIKKLEKEIHQLRSLPLADADLVAEPPAAVPVASGAPDVVSSTNAATAEQA